MVEKEDFQTLVTAAQKYVVVQVKKERKLEKLLHAAEKTIAGLKAKVAELTETISTLTKQLDQYRSVKGQLDNGKLRQENTDLRQQNSFYKSAIEQHGLAHLLGRKKEQRQTRDVR
jgi:FtsZ-binding cell division protein ZapB